MIIADQCPEQLNLDRFATGRYPAHPPQDAATIARHVGSCDACRRQIESAKADERFLSSIRAELLSAATGEAAAPSTGTSRAMFAKSEPLPRIAGFRVVVELGRGGMGVVYEAEQAHPRRRVALKVIRDARSASSEQVARFHREVDALGALQHPGIATVFHAGITDDGDPYFTMELVEGRTLAEVAPSLPLRARLDLFIRVCEAVQYAHDRGVAHRDLKPGNILVTMRPGGGAGAAQVRLVDFGLAHLGGASGAEATLTRPGHVQGTPRYMSPEQISGRRRAAPDAAGAADRAGDIYSLGVILYELATGAPAFDFTNTAWYEMARAVCEACFSAPSAVNPDVPVALERTILRAMATSPADRHASAAELAADARRAMDEKPPRRRELRRRLHAPSRRAWRIGLAVSAMLLAGLATVAAPMWSQPRVAEEQAPTLAAGPAPLYLDRDLAVNPDELDSTAATLRASLDAQSGEPQPARATKIAMDLAMVCEAAGRYDEACAILQRISEDGRRRVESRVVAMVALMRLARVQHESGRLEEARQTIGRARAVLNSPLRPSPPAIQSELCSTHAAILADLGDLGPAGRMLSESRRHAAAAPGPAPWLQFRLDAATAIVHAAHDRHPRPAPYTRGAGGN